MNILDWIVLIIILYMTLTGIFRGFIHSALSLAAFFFSWLCSMIFSPLMSKALINNNSIYTFIYNFTEGSERIVDFEDSRLLVSKLSPDNVNELVAQSNLPMPFNSLLRENIFEQAFKSDGLTTLGEYYDMIISNIFINIISFMIVFFIAILIFDFIINSANYTLKFPVLKRYDTLVGSFLGLIRGFFITYALFVLTPLALVLVPLTQVYDLVYDSLFASFFYTTNFMLDIIKGII